jgi:hypothetical protein
MMVFILEVQGSEIDLEKFEQERLLIVARGFKKRPLAALTEKFKIAEKEIFKSYKILSVRKIDKGIFSVLITDEKGLEKNVLLEKMEEKSFLELKEKNEKVVFVEGEHCDLIKFI